MIQPGPGVPRQAAGGVFGRSFWDTGVLNAFTPVWPPRPCQAHRVASEGNLVRIKGMVALAAMALGPGYMDVNRAMVRVGGLLVGSSEIFRGDGFVEYRRSRTGPSWFRLMDSDGNPVSVRFATMLHEPRVLEVLDANQWQLLERARSKADPKA